MKNNEEMDLLTLIEDQLISDSSLTKAMVDCRMDFVIKNMIDSFINGYHNAQKSIFSLE